MAHTLHGTKAHLIHAEIKVARSWTFVLVAVLALLAGRASAQNDSPPVGAIFDLSGQPLPSSYTEYQTSFTAVGTSTYITFAFRNDPGYFGFDDASLVDTTTSSSNLFLNPGFETGDLTDWTYLNEYGAAYGGAVQSGTSCGNVSGPHSGTYFWCDGATQAYDAITQVVGTNIGDSYTVSFWLTQANSNDVGQTQFQDLSTNGLAGTDGNGIDVLVYAAATVPGAAPGSGGGVTTPEPATMAILGAGLAGLGAIRRRKKA